MIKPVYYPILKSKTAEWKALAALDRAILPFAPVIDIVPPPTKRKVETTEHQWLDEVREAIASSCAGGLVLVDPFLLRADNGADGAESGFTYFAGITAADQGAVSFVPVVRLGTSDNGVKLAAAVADRYAAGAAIRILEGEVSSIPIGGGAAFNDRVSDLVTALGVPRGEIDLLVDLGAVDRSTSADLYVNGLMSALPAINQIQAFRTVVLAGSSAPPMSSVAKFAMAVVPRTELEIHRKLSDNMAPLVNLVFGDYAGFAPDLPSGEARTKHPSLRYAREEDLVIVRREAEKGTGFSAFTEVSDFIVSQQWYDGDQFSWGDNHLQQVANRATTPSGGGSTAWRAIAVNHHITKTVGQFASPLVP